MFKVFSMNFDLLKKGANLGLSCAGSLLPVNHLPLQSSGGGRAFAEQVGLCFTHYEQKNYQLE